MRIRPTWLHLTPTEAVSEADLLILIRCILQLLSNKTNILKSICKNLVAISCVVTLTVDISYFCRVVLGLDITGLLGALFTVIRDAPFWIACSCGNYNVCVKTLFNNMEPRNGFLNGAEMGVLLSQIHNDENKIGNVISVHVNIILQ